MQSEMDKVTKVATLVGSRLARLVMDARRSTTGNTQLVEELKRYNRRLEASPQCQHRAQHSRSQEHLTGCPPCQRLHVSPLVQSACLGTQLQHTASRPSKPLLA